MTSVGYAHEVIERTRVRLLRYLGALSLTLAVIAGRLALDPWWGRTHNRHLVFLPTLMVAAGFGGLGPGLLSAVLLTLALDYFWSSPRHELSTPNVELVLFLLLGAAIIALVESLRRARARADAAARAREQVLSIVAHDLRNHLATVKMTSAALQARSPDPATLRRRLLAVDRAVNRMDGLMGDIVDATRIEHGGMELSIHDEPLEPLVDEAIESFAAKARDKGVALTSDSAAAGLTIPCDRSRVLQVLCNLLGNSLKFTPPGGEIGVRVSRTDQAVQLEVRDTGPGIRAEDRPQIFERYWTSDRNGNGLGLFIARSIVTGHGGRIWVETEPGRGARFFFTLPRVAPSATGAEGRKLARARRLFESVSEPRVGRRIARLFSARSRGAPAPRG
jgi:signal transduction histidine kinase